MGYAALVRAAIDAKRQPQGGLEFDRLLIGRFSRPACMAQDHFGLQGCDAMFFREILDRILLLSMFLISHDTPDPVDFHR
ncbi:hypothetical protein [Mesorhizobium sp. RMAD-H1]|uniref:hypothetical protein n=1 Tax=Mesorhizobium sp. RMAD-H1 TaxID=2587065 RepID=UPI00162237C6|nr:hypothetical protein [Mesorhizobium sp. RMAD-H1]MBB2971527.1 hypothetical protein [Mesorhizobium sp. RMAD-H1]